MPIFPPKRSKNQISSMYINFKLLTNRVINIQSNINNIYFLRVRTMVIAILTYSMYNRMLHIKIVSHLFPL